MDNKSSDDSVGSDSLDKSLLKKCVVDDAGDGAQNLKLDDELPCCSKSIKVVATKKITEHKKTEKGKGDGEGVLSESVSKVQCQIPEASVGCSALPKAANNSRSGALKTKVISALEMDTTNSSSCSTFSCNSPQFETKVKQIAQDLMETSLIDADLAAAAEAVKQTPGETTAICKKITLDEASSSSAEMDKPVNDNKDGAPQLRAPSIELPSTSKSAANRLQTDGIEVETETSHCTTDANDDNDPNSTSKKVHFHPEVKGHDGGIRVVPKKKKKSKETELSDNEMEQDDEEEDEDDDDEDDDDDDDDDEEVEAEAGGEGFNVSKIFDEAEEYLKDNPLFIDRSPEAGTPIIPDGLMEEEDEKNLPESDEEEDVYADSAPPENGVERVLGKIIKDNKVSYLVRYVEKSKVTWESEEFVTKQCPTILEDYEIHRQKLQHRLMNYVAKRKKFRQRYNDF